MNELPDGWERNKLSSVADIEMGQSPSSSTYNKSKIGLPFFQGKAEFGKLYPTPVKYCSQPLKVARTDDILISVRAPVGPTNLCASDSCIGRGLAAIRPAGDIPSRFLLYYLRSIESWLSEQGSGSTFSAISKTDLMDVSVLLPPLKEQDRIVAKLEDLLSRVDAIQVRVATIPGILKRFRQSVIAAACAGHLTTVWRDFNPHLRAIPLLQTVRKHDHEVLPNHWQRVQIGSVIEGLKYGTSKKCGYEQRGIPVLRIPNISGGVIQTTDLKYAELPQHEYNQLKLIYGDILLIRSNGSVSLIGKSAMVRNAESGFAYAGYLIRLRPNRSYIHPQFLNLALSSHDVRLQIEIPARSTSGVNNLNSDEVRALEIPLPPLVEQQEIARRVEELFKTADALEARYYEAKAFIDKLTQSIFAKAFKGELVPAEAELARQEGREYESVSVLLERIRADRNDKHIKKARSNGKTRKRA